VYTGYPRMLIEQEMPNVVVISKPALPDQLVAAIARLLD
jgi:hypothetical protein